MNWKIIRINTWWSAEEANIMLMFLDELRDQLVHTHGEQIMAYQRAEADEQANDQKQYQLGLEDDIEF